MIKSINYKDIIINLRKEIIKQSGISDDRVLNALSVRGTDLTKILDDSILSYDISDCFIIFELVEDNSKTSYTTPNENSMDSIANFNMLLKIYGNSSYIVSQMLKSRLKNPNVITELRNKGIYLTSIDNIVSVNEFINNTYWIRHDMTLNITVRFNFNNIEDEGYVEAINKTIIKVI